jgi:ubiquinone/menaquinone biosynthesis C-methylase UbiE
VKASPDRDIERFNEWAPSYDGSVLQRVFFMPIHRRMVAAARDAFAGTAPASILDVGCGTGRLLRAVGVLWPEAALQGVDPAETMLNQARRLSPRVAFERGVAEALPFTGPRFDLAVSSLSFHHWRDQAAGIREIARVLTPGGVFCLADHTFIPARVSGERVRTRREVRAFMEQAGLQVIMQRNAVYPYVVMTIARKVTTR